MSLNVLNLQRHFINYPACILFFFLPLCLPVSGLLAQSQQDFTVSGTVTDASTGETLPGVNISVKGTTTGTASAADGSYSLTAASSQDTLVFSFVGYQANELAIRGRSNVNAALNSEAIAGEELVVVGYGEQERKDVTGAISSVSSEDINQQRVATIGQALQGQVAGVNITNNSWNPGSDAQIRIRGNRSITAGNDPLIIVDGVSWNGSLSDINTGDIASARVLKDASATAIYGARGANGVILIETKEGKPGATEITYHADVGMQKVRNNIDLMDASEFINFRREAYQAAGQDTSMQNIFSPVELSAINDGVSTDWPSLVLRDGFQTNQEFSVSGGDENAQYSIAPSFFDQNNIFRGQDYKRYSLRSNIDYQIGDKFETGVSSIITRSFQNLNTGAGDMFRIPPIVPAYDSTGALIYNPANDDRATNPLSEIENTTIQNERWRVFGRLYGEYNLNPWLSYRLNVGVNFNLRNHGEFIGSETIANVGGEPTASQSERQVLHYTIDNILKINQTFGNSHKIDATFLYSIESNRRENSYSSVRGLPSESQLYYSLGSASTITGVNSQLTEWKLQSYMGRVNYSFNDTYLLTFTGRVDGSSRLAPKNRYSFFPSAALAWRVSNESFMESLANSISELKFRLSYGITGNTAIQPYQTQGGLTRTDYTFGNSAAFGYKPSDLPNPNLNWESTKQFNAGINFGLFNDKITGDIDYYLQRTNDLLLTQQIPSSLGYSSILSNIGETKNTGLNVSLSTNNIRNENFSWSTNLNFSTNKNEIEQLYGDGGNDVANRWFIGQPIDVYYDYKFDGIWQQEQAEQASRYGSVPGEIRVVDQNDDTQINGDDRVILGSSFPDWTGGITNRFEYRNIDLSFLITATQGNMIENDMLGGINKELGRYNNLAIDYWTPSSPSNQWPRPNHDQENPIYGGSLQYQDGSFVRVRNVTLGYSLPQSFVSSIGMDSWRVYASAQNLLLFTSDSFVGGYDPDGGTEIGQSPSYRTFTIGLNINL